MGEVVINKCYGGFSLSRACVQYMANMGSKLAAEALAHITGDPTYANETLDVDAYAFDRHDPLLIKAVRELGTKANTSSSKLVIVKLSGNAYRINQYDGFESLEEPCDIKWITINREEESEEEPSDDYSAQKKDAHARSVNILSDINAIEGNVKISGVNISF